MKTRRFHSHATSPGIVIGRAHRIEHRGSPFARTWIKDADVEQEIDRFKSSVQKAKEQLTHIQAKMCRFQGHDQIKIIESYRMFLQDDMLVAATQKHIRDFKINAEWALDKTLAHLKLSFLNVNEEYFRERQQDIDYVGRRLMDNLVGSPELSFDGLPAGEAVLVVHDFSPAEVASLPRDRVRGFVMEGGGETSHSAIIAKALEIPAMFGMGEVFDEIGDGEQVILDGIKGVLIASPTAKELEQYRSIQKKYEALEEILLRETNLPAVTKDGFRLMIEANMEIVEEIPSIVQHGAEGIGLYRTEYLFLNRLDEPSEEEQYENYLTVLSRLAPKPVTIRTIDLGGDKLSISQSYEAQTNPALGLRAIRLCLREIPLFKTQLRALYRASVHGNLRILIPMISSVDEIRRVRKIVDEVKNELAEKNLPFEKDVPLGIMIEVPSAVFMASELAAYSDFFSIGTNDLIQYGLAIDRVNEQVAHLYNPYHPAVLRMIKRTVDAAKKAGIEVGICGELAGDPLAITLMVGMELNSLSMNPVSIPRVKKILRAVTREQSATALKQALAKSTADEVERYLKRKTSHLLPGDVKRLHIIEGQSA
ncbi:MAG: phosphoenolpyruvate--protein phosphotransferase [Proteobacteria bacterium]|nr:phosphoenolpyruvate--protein phosphotransferase [Pseudomonadota bacterium]